MAAKRGNTSRKTGRGAAKKAARKKPQARKPRKKATRKKAGSGAGIDWQMVRAVSIPVLAVVALLGVGIGSVIGLSKLRDRAATILMVSDQELDLSVPPIKINWPPSDPSDKSSGSWLPESKQLELLDAARKAAGPRDPLSRRPLSGIRQKLEQSGWFTASPVVRRDEFGSIVVEAQWRTPFAAVRSQGVDYLVSAQGKPMPYEWLAGKSGMIVILGSSTKPVSPGSVRFQQAWPDERVLKGLELLKKLCDQPYADQIQAIDISPLALSPEKPGAGMIEIVTKFDTRVVWGSPVGAFRPGEQTDEVKLARLNDLMRQYGRIDGRTDRITLYGPVVEIDRRNP